MSGIFRFYLFVIIASSSFISCALITPPVETVPAEGYVYFEDAILNLKYDILSVHVYTREGNPLVTVEPQKIYKPAQPPVIGPGGVTLTPEPELDYIKWSADVPAPIGTAITFWIEFIDSITNTIYFSDGQQDIITGGNSYSWTVSELFVPIGNESELRLIGSDPRFLPNQNYALVRDISLTKDWIPICGESIPFSGVFEGNGRTIRNLRFTSGDLEFTGLFGVVKTNGTKRAALRNFSIELESNQIELRGLHSQYIGILAGIAENCDIEKITVRRSGDGSPQALTIIQSGGSALYVGGIAGAAQGGSTANKTKISSSDFLIPLSVAVDYTGSALKIFGGGIAGLAGTAAASGNSVVVIEKCYMPFNIGITIFRGTPAGSAIYAGGIAGGCADTTTKLDIIETLFVGNISAQNTATCYTGGIFGGGTTQANLKIEKSVALTNRIEYSATSPNVDRISGQASTASGETHAAVPFAILPSRAGSSTTRGIDRERTRIDDKWFSDQNAYGGLGWDFNSTWRWNDVFGFPVFRWE